MDKNPMNQDMYNQEMMNPMNQQLTELNQKPMMMLNNSLEENNEEDSKESERVFGISVIFRQTWYGAEIPFMVQCTENEKVSDIIEKYRIKAKDNDCSEKFIFNAKQLVPSRIVGESGLTNNANIFVEKTHRIKGAGCSMFFSDLSKNKTREILFSKKAPSYRSVSKGINIFGICNFKKCIAHLKEVVVKIKKKKFDLIKQRNELFCPECEAQIIPKTVGFYLCKFKIYGKKIEDGSEVNFENKIDEASNKNGLKYFDPELNGEVMITELIFEVMEYF